MPMDTLERPYSTRFSEHYWSGGRDEKRFVFLDANDLARRFAENRDFSIGELGFGTGMNFLLSRALWQEIAPADRCMTFISYELYPLPVDELQRLHGPAGEGFWELYMPQPGWNTMVWGNVTLKLFIGEARTGLAEHYRMVDCWFLDGFSPAKNPEMWTPEVLARVGALTVPKGTVSTYSVAAAVREGLKEAGFEVQKTAGFPPKEHMLKATKPF